MKAPYEDLTSMALFAEVVQHRSFSTAARALGLAKSAISKRVSLLEERLGVRLLTRTTRKLSLKRGAIARAEVAAGRDLEVDASLAAKPPLARARHQRVVQAVVADQLRRSLRATVRVEVGRRAADDQAIRRDPARDQRRIREPLDADDDVEATLDHVDDAIVGGQLDLDVAMAVEERGERPSEEQMGERDRSVDPQRASRGRARPGNRLLGRVGGGEQRGAVLVVANAILGRHAAAAGLGLAVVPLFMAAADVAAGKLELVLEEARRAEIGIYAVYASRRQLPARTRLLLDHLATWFATPDWRLR